MITQTGNLIEAKKQLQKAINLFNNDKPQMSIGTNLYTKTQADACLTITSR